MEKLDYERGEFLLRTPFIYTETRVDDVQRYAATIRAWLQAHGGRPVGRRRAIADPAGLPSLRAA
jgi:hypothetical protein